MKFKRTLLATFLMAILMPLAHAEGIDNQKYYESHKGQIFKPSDIIETSAGYVRGDKVQYITWQGFISGLPFYFELHGEKLTIEVAKKRSVFLLRKVPAIRGGNQEYVTISEAGSDFYVKSAPNAKDSMICIESLGPNIYIPIIPYWEVYLIAKPLTSPRVYRLSGINASCRGIEQTSDGSMIIPEWKISRKNIPNVIIDYYFLENNGFRKSNIQVTGMIASDDGLEYLLNENP